jgi:hypothetical protein
MKNLNASEFVIEDVSINTSSMLVTGLKETPVKIPLVGTITSV